APQLLEQGRPPPLELQPVGTDRAGVVERLQRLGVVLLLIQDLAALGVGIAQEEDLGGRETSPCQQPNRLGEVAQRLRQVAASALDLAPLVVERSQLGLEANRRVKLGEGPVVVLFLDVDLRRHQVGVILLRLQADRLLKVLPGVGVFRLQDQGGGPVHAQGVGGLLVRLSVEQHLRREEISCRGGEVLRRLLLVPGALAELTAGITAQEVDPHKSRPPALTDRQASFRLVGLLELQGTDRQIILSPEVVWLEPQRVLVVSNGLGQFLAVDALVAQQEVIDSIGRLGPLRLCRFPGGGDRVVPPEQASGATQVQGPRGSQPGRLVKDTKRFGGLLDRVLALQRLCHRLGEDQQQLITAAPDFRPLRGGVPGLRTEIEDRARWHAVAALPRRRAVRWSRGPRKYGTRR